jgi:hypothetical protein
LLLVAVVGGQLAALAVADDRAGAVVFSATLRPSPMSRCRSRSRRQQATKMAFYARPSFSIAW